jgi:hypothetical protein
MTANFAFRRTVKGLEFWSGDDQSASFVDNPDVLGLSINPLLPPSNLILPFLMYVVPGGVSLLPTLVHLKPLPELSAKASLTVEILFSFSDFETFLPDRDVLLIGCPLVSLFGVVPLPELIIRYPDPRPPITRTIIRQTKIMEKPD